MYIGQCKWNKKQMLNASFHYFQSLSKKCLCMLQTTPLLCRIQTRLWCDTGAWHSVLLDKDHEGGGGQEQGDGVKAVIILLRLQMLQVAEGGKGEGGVCRRRRAIHTQEQVAGQLEGCRGAPKISWGWRQWLAGRRAGKTRVQTLPRLARCCLLAPRSQPRPLLQRYPRPPSSPWSLGFFTLSLCLALKSPAFWDSCRRCRNSGREDVNQNKARLSSKLPAHRLKHNHALVCIAFACLQKQFAQQSTNVTNMKGPLIIQLDLLVWSGVTSGLKIST